MKLDEAIKILNDILHYVEPGDPPEEHDATKLGIEALKWFQNFDDRGGKGARFLLPGETQD